MRIADLLSKVFHQKFSRVITKAKKAEHLAVKFVVLFLYNMYFYVNKKGTTNTFKVFIKKQ
jgi:hypothetical protein